ncbi:hypothetical protein ANO11243_034320 [Dothideomycetidae sp. 11243]|nr:hypothetical protein ANO11243_034320 [fungal sp. No.11243]
MAKNADGGTELWTATPRIIYVYLELEYSNNISDGITDIEILHRDTKLEGGYADIADGAGGCYVYLDVEKKREKPYKINEVALLRSSEEKTTEDVQAKGYHGMSNNINTRRGGDFLYVIWKFHDI